MDPDLIDPLTQREIEVLRLLESRLSHEEITAVLHISSGVLQRYRNRIYWKLRLLASRAPEGESPP